MNKKLALATFSLLLIIESCTTSYYQVYNVSKSDADINELEAIIYDHEYFTIEYNFWSQGGSTNFSIYNTSDSSIYFDMTNCFLVVNGEAHNYYDGKIFQDISVLSMGSQSTTGSTRGGINTRQSVSSRFTNMDFQSSSQTTGSRFTQSNSETVAQPMIVCIPAKSYKTFYERKLSSYIYRDCDLGHTPKKGLPSSTFFNFETSPLKIENRLAYSIQDNDSLIRIQNDFFVSKISNYYFSDVLDREQVVNCGVKQSRYITTNNQAHPSRYFLYYSATPSIND
ncbi:hypothetical protein GYB22_03465 [bacterium]|nr:hypothetical protein [bacterium]